MQEEITLEEIEHAIATVLRKSTEVNALLRDGKIIVAYEKFGGIVKNLSALGGKLQSCARSKASSDDVDTE